MFFYFSKKKYQETQNKTIKSRKTILMSNPEVQERIVKVEITYYRQTQKSDVTARADLCPLNKISHTKRLENFLIILTNTDITAMGLEPTTT